MFWSVGWPLLRAEDFFYNLDILYGGLGIGKLQFLIKKEKKNFSFNFFFNFWSFKPWIRIGFGSGSVLVSNIKLWIRIRIRKNEYGSTALLKSPQKCKSKFFLIFLLVDGRIRIQTRIRTYNYRTVRIWILQEQKHPENCFPHVFPIIFALKAQPIVRTYVGQVL